MNCSSYLAIECWQLCNQWSCDMAVQQNHKIKQSNFFLGGKGVEGDLQILKGKCTSIAITVPHLKSCNHSYLTFDQSYCNVMNLLLVSADDSGTDHGDELNSEYVPCWPPVFWGILTATGRVSWSGVIRGLEICIKYLSFCSSKSL